MRHKTFHQAALLSGILLIILIISTCGLAVDPTGVDGNRLGVTPMMPMTEPMPRYDNARQVVPGPPVQPNAGSRPASWPGSPAPVNMPAGVTAQQVPAAAPVELFEGTTIIARVGSEAIFAYEIMGSVNEILDRYKDKIPPEQLEMQRTILIKQRLMGRIESKLIYLDAKATIPAEGLANAEKQISKAFENTELPNMLKRSKMTSPKELDEKLRGLGSSLEREKKNFIERVLAQQWARQQIKRDEEITYDQMLKYYRQHQSEFEKPAKAKWEEIMVQFSKFPDKAQAYSAIARLGNQVFAGAAFADVAKNGSQGATASQGGQYDWTTKGSLKYEEIDQAIFKLPERQLSQIIQTEKGFHIIRVTQRVETEVTPFLTAQVDIKEKIIEERTAKQSQEYLARLENKIPVWTIFDGDQLNLRMADRFKELR